MRTIYLAVLVAMVAGCAAENATLVNEKGEKRYCYKDSGGAMSNIGRSRDFQKCMNEAGAAGFKRVPE